MIAKCDLPFAFVERKSFRELIHLLNKDAMPLVNTTNQAAVATHVGRMYSESEKTIKNKFQYRLLKMRGHHQMLVPLWQ
jgi:hypothetical protein